MLDTVTLLSPETVRSLLPRFRLNTEGRQLRKLWPGSFLSAAAKISRTHTQHILCCYVVNALTDVFLNYLLPYESPLGLESSLYLLSQRIILFYLRKQSGIQLQHPPVECEYPEKKEALLSVKTSLF